MNMTQSMDMDETDYNYVGVGSVSYETDIKRFRSFDEYMDVSSSSEDVLLSETQENENINHPVVLNNIGDMDIETYRFILEKRFSSAQERYKGLEEYMEIPDMDVWLRLKREIIENKVFDYKDDLISNPGFDEEEYFDNFKDEDEDEYYQAEYYQEEYDDYVREENRIERFKDKWMCDRRNDRYD
jgi:hypothetical protein